MSVGADANSKLGGKPVLKYLDLVPLGGLGGRGGTVRFFLLANGVDFSEDLVERAKWPEVKQEIIESGENPAGHVPIIFLGDKVLTEHHATMRYISKLLGIYGNDVDFDYAVDQVADATVTWRTDWVASRSATLGAEEKTTFVFKQLPGHAKVIETLLERHGAQGNHVIAGRPSFSDALVFGLYWDALGTHGEQAAKVLQECPKLTSFFQSYKQLPRVAEWCAKARPQA